MFLDFGWFREQVCMVACPYGRLQSVLLDRRSLIVGYDARRGRAARHLQASARRRASSPLDAGGRRPGARVMVAGDARVPAFGDCIDCGAPAW